MAQFQQKALDPTGAFELTDRFANRHIGPSDADIEKMLGVLGGGSLEAFT